MFEPFLARRRMPVMPDVGWDRGAPVDAVDELAEHWATEFDWRRRSSS